MRSRADRAQICWTLGITEHHDAVDNVLALINLALLTGPRRPLGLGPEPAARAEQRPGWRRHGRHPQQARRDSRTSSRTTAHARCEKAWGAIPPTCGWRLTEMLHAMARRHDDVALRDWREPHSVGRRRRACREGDQVARSSCRTSSSPRPPSSRTWCCPPQRAGASPKAR